MRRHYLSAPAAQYRGASAHGHEAFQWDMAGRLSSRRLFLDAALFKNGRRFIVTRRHARRDKAPQLFNSHYHRWRLAFRRTLY